MKIGNFRAPFFNYRKPGIFLITMNKTAEYPDFSKLKLNESETAKEKRIGVKYKDLGFAIFNELEKFNEQNDNLSINQYIIMPDHIHLLIEINKELDQPLGNYIAILKRRIYLEAEQRGLTIPGSKSLFEKGFNDQFLRHDRNLDKLYKYIQTNPYRLWIRRVHPDYFKRINEAFLCEINCSLYGNLNLLENPFIFPVIIHRSDSGKELEKKKEFWRYVALNGGVLASPFISPAEKEIFEGAAKHGCKLILISNKAFAQREKPTGKLFELCEKGQLLIISPQMDCTISEKGISRKECLFMNSLAEKLSAFKNKSGIDFSAS